MAYSLLRWWAQVLLLILSILAWVLFAYLHYAQTLELLNLFDPILALSIPFSLIALVDAVSEQVRRTTAETLLAKISALLEETRQQKEAVAQLSAVKTQMIRMASHDLKNPLSRITAYVSMMRDFPPAQGLDPRTQKAFSQIGKAADDMLHIVDDILTLDRARSSNLKAEDFDLAELVRDLTNIQESHAQRKNQSLSMDIDQEAWVRGDEQKLRQALTNLVDNAIKYTPEGGKIVVSLHQRGASLHFKVTDSGYGIAPEAQKQLFTEFYRVQTRETANISGTGLGLSLVKAIIDQHQGKIGVESQEGLGSTFWVELPALRREASTRMPA